MGIFPPKAVHNHSDRSYPHQWYGYYSYDIERRIISNLSKGELNRDGIIICTFQPESKDNAFHLSIGLGLVLHHRSLKHHTFGQILST